MNASCPWPMMPLGRLCTPRLGGNYKNDSVATGRPLIKMGNIARIRIDVSRLEYIPNPERVDAVHRLRFGDVLLNTRNTLELVGKVSIWRDELPVAYYNSNIMRLEFNAEYCGDSQYFGYALNSANSIKSIRDIATGTTSVAAVYTRDLLKLQIPVPSRREQRHIAAALADVDDLIAALERLIAKKQAIKQGMMQQLLTGHTRLPGFRDEWMGITLGTVARFSKGAGLPKSKLTASGAIPCIHYGELFTFYGPEIRHVSSRTDLTGRMVFSEDLDVLMPTSDVTPRGLAKASAIHGNGVVLGGDILVIRPDKTRAYGPFLAHAIRLDADQVLQLVRGSTVYHLYAADMRNFTLAIPSVEEQRAISDALLDVEREIEVIEDRLTKAQDIKTGMMQQLLTGRTRLPVEAAS